jgi:hypothetical protein
MAETPQSPNPTLKSCDVCGAKVTELRRGRCWGCYTQWVEARPVGFGAACTMCNDRRREHLKSVELLGTWVPVCHNCHARALHLEPMPQSLEEIRQRLDRERRLRDRRAGKPDSRIFKRERRGLERRSRGHAAGDDLLLVDDDILIVEHVEPVLASGGGADGFGRDEETRIQLAPLPVPPPPPAGSGER